MQSERSISLLNLFHQKSPKWIYQSPPNPPQFPQNGGYHSPKDSSYLFMVCRGWHLKMGEFYIKLYQDSVSNANVFCYLITKPLISSFCMMTLRMIQVRNQKWTVKMLVVRTSCVTFDGSPTFDSDSPSNTLGWEIQSDPPVKSWRHSQTGIGLKSPKTWSIARCNFHENIVDICGWVRAQIIKYT